MEAGLGSWVWKLGFEVWLEILVLTSLVRCGICWGLLSLTISDFVSCLSDGMFLSAMFGGKSCLVGCFVWLDALFGGMLCLVGKFCFVG